MRVGNFPDPPSMQGSATPVYTGPVSTCKQCGMHCSICTCVAVCMAVEDFESK